MEGRIGNPRLVVNGCWELRVLAVKFIAKALLIDWSVNWPTESDRMEIYMKIIKNTREHQKSEKLR